MRFSRSTMQPPSLKMSSASSSSTKTPVRSSTSSVARWMSSISASVNTLRLKPPLRGRPANRFLFTLLTSGQCAARVVRGRSAPQPTRSLNRSTLLIGMSSTSAMWNFASSAPGWSG